MASVSKKALGVSHVEFRKENRRWVAHIYVDASTCVSWQTVGTLRNVRTIIREQLEPAMIPSIIFKAD